MMNNILQKLQEKQKYLANSHLRDLFATDPRRVNYFSQEDCGLLIDFSKNLIDQETLNLLCQLVNDLPLATTIQNLFSGEKINSSENLPALHPALRLTTATHSHEHLVEIKNERDRMYRFAELIQQGHQRGFTNQTITTIVNLGIGGADLGPRCVTEALSPYQQQLKIYFVANIGTELQQLLQSLNPAETLFICSSKSFSTLETLKNMEFARQWLGDALGSPKAFFQHFIAVTAKSEKAKHYGFQEHQIFKLWDFIGGRYSLWSATGLPILLAIGRENFDALLAGAHAMDVHFQQQQFSRNLPVILAMLEFWYRNFFNCQTQAVLPYLQHLQYLPAYLQQLVMESNGKTVTQHGDALTLSSAPVIWGGVGTHCQHSFMQMLHQGSTLIPVEFIAALKTEADDMFQQIILANCLGQSRVLMQGKTYEEAYQQMRTEGYDDKLAKHLAPHKVLQGNRPSTTIIFEQLTPYTLGALLCLYEHKVVTAAALLNINPFDQWGVEMGKEIALELLPFLQTPSDELHYDYSTNFLIKYYWTKKKNNFSSSVIR